MYIVQQSGSWHGYMHARDTQRNWCDRTIQTKGKMVHFGTCIVFLPLSVKSVDNFMYSNLLLNRRLLLEFLFTIHTSVSTIIFLSYPPTPHNIQHRMASLTFSIFSYHSFFLLCGRNAMCGDGIDSCLQPNLIHWINFLHSSERAREREWTFSNFSVSVVMFQSSASQKCRQTQCYGEKWDEFGEINLVCGFRQFKLFLHH